MLTEASDCDVKGVPAVVFAAHASILGHCRPVSDLSVRLVPGGSGSRLWVILVILVEVSVLHHAEAGGGAQVLAAALVLLDGLVERPQLAQQGHVLLTQTHLEGAAIRSSLIHDTFLMRHSTMLKALPFFTDI